MALAITHAFQSAKADPPDTTLVRPSNWNASHTITAGANVVLGVGNTPGAVTELTCTALAQAILASSNLTAVLAALGCGAFTTGDVKLTLKTLADSGWIMMNDGTIGDASSSATFASSTAQALYTLLWNNVSDTYAPVTGGRGVDAATDWGAHKPIALTKVLGRALAAAGTGSGLTARTLGSTVGEENHTLSVPELPTFTPVGAVNVNNDVLTTTSEAIADASTDATRTYVTGGTPGTKPISLNSIGSGSQHNNMQPTSFLNVMIKL